MLVSLLLAAGCRHPVDLRAHITIWHQKIGPERELFEQIIRQYNSAHSDRVIEPLYKENEELRSLYIIAAVAGQGPDLIYGPADNVGVLVTT